ncbi:hypothetical protein [Microbulbifer sp. YPW16]|uniref:DUF6630 family protein n=1 Tax=unclassified Microbulbifer TaxID=2619833 RepID=UPI001E62D468|nr:hypothetical protein [Microbulbifer sp. YPW16]UHQ57058.1 hypothetical protein LVE68_08780 [Microbulbifer sp. YPW16]
MVWNLFRKKQKNDQNRDLVKLSRVLAYSDPQLHSFIERFIQFRREFHAMHGGLKQFRGIDVSGLTDTECEYPEEDVFQGFLEYYQDSGNLLIADWSSSISDLEPEINALFCKHSIPKVSDFSAFHIEEKDHPNRIFEKLAPHVSNSGKKLIGLQIHEDSHNCAIVLENQFSEIKNVEFEDGVCIFAW